MRMATPGPGRRCPAKRRDASQALAYSQTFVAKEISQDGRIEYRFAPRGTDVRIRRFAGSTWRGIDRLIDRMNRWIPTRLDRL